ncbi:VOC family protein [Cohnella fermenti]|uniref:VOC family protein n=1 Tax=Cohnella fermenti TaxID=2565925 RepID=A0A4S4BUM4_9BACL|nr:VOC family protein [Cohnella fermenti]THF78807.1 VOC family protein [Cohnella fermenti]
MASIHPAARIGLVSIKVASLERSIRFYQSLIGFNFVKEIGRTAELSTDGGRPLLLLEEVPNPVPLARRHAGLYHFAILVPDRKSLGLTVRHLAENGVPLGQGDHWVSEAFYLNDPDGNGIEIYADRPRDTWEYEPTGAVRMGTDPVDVESLLQLAGNERWEGLPAGTTMGHIHLHVSELPATRRFYCELLGFDLMAMYGDAAMFVSAGGYHHHIGLNTWAGVGAKLAPEGAVGLKDYEIVVPDIAAFSEIEARLQAAQYPCEHEGAELRVKDPTGIAIRITAR